MNRGGAVLYQIHNLAEDPFTPVSQAVSGEDIRAVAILDQSLFDDE